MRRAALAFTLCLAGCTTAGHDSVADKVLTDFGIRAKPDGMESPADSVYGKLSDIGAAEIKRMNAANRRGEIKAQEDGLRVSYYREAKVYENFFPLEAAPITGGTYSERGYRGYIEYEYRVYQSPRVDSRAEAENQSASISTSESGRESYRYTFSSGGIWNGSPGESVRN